MKRLSVLALALVALLLAACGTPQRPDAGLDRAATPFGAIRLFSDNDVPLVPPPGATVQEERVSHATGRSDFHVLAISGGGSDGAFGAGVLKGWTASGKRPVFNIVTGVSTGALIASFAFLGSEWDDEIEEFYTRTTNAQVYESRGLSGLFRDSLYDVKPLRAVIARVANERMIDAVAAEHRKGRRLYVATTDLDSGTLVVWDMGGIAASGHPDRLALYRELLVASAAVPGFFRPIFLRDGTATRMHVDGGVKAPILLRSFMVAGPQPRKTVHMLVNGKLPLRAEAGAVTPALLDISKRSISELMRGLLYKTIYQGYVATRQARAGFRLLYVPDAETEIDDALRFNPAELRRLFELGERIGRDPANWRREPPRLEPLERIPAR